MKRLILLIALFPLITYSSQLKIMTYNVENLFDTSHDSYTITEEENCNNNEISHIENSLKVCHKEDFSLLPLTVKTLLDTIPQIPSLFTNYCKSLKFKSWQNSCFKTDWNDNLFNEKVQKLTTSILTNLPSGPDILFLSEVESLKALEALNKALGGIYHIAFIDGRDARGIDVAIFSKFEFTMEPLLHQTVFPSADLIALKDTRGILQTQIVINNKELNLFAIHFPSEVIPNPMGTEMRVNQIDHLNSLMKEGDNVLVGGDFNITGDQKYYEMMTPDNKKVSHFEGCKKCKGTYASVQDQKVSWALLDAFIYRLKDLTVVENSIKVANKYSEQNQYIQMGSKKIKIPLRFNQSIPSHGVSDHWPLIMELE